MDFKYPYTDAHELNLDWFLTQFKTLTENWAQVQSDWTDLHDYVQNYFDNLDVQEEINNKIQSMIDDNSFATILTPLVAAALPSIVDGKLPTVVAAQIGAVVADQIGAVVAGQLPAVAATAAAQEVGTWLAAHIDPDTGYVIDDTLTVQNAAADAKAVGDRFNDVNNNIDAVNNAISVSDTISDTAVMLDGDIVNSVHVDVSGTLAVNNSNIFDLTDTQGQTYPTGQTCSIVGDSITITAAEVRKYIRVWFELPEGKSLIGKYISAKADTPTNVTAGLSPVCGVAWVNSVGVFAQGLVNLTSNNNYEYNNKLVTTPSDPDSKLVVYVELNQSTNSTIGDHATFSNIQVNYGITVSSDYEAGKTDVYTADTLISKTGNFVLMSEDGFTVDYGIYAKMVDLTNAMYNKKVLIIGDSISTGTSSAKRIPGTNYENYDKWVDWLISRYQLKDSDTYNMSIHASGYVATNQYFAGNTFLYRLQNQADKGTFDTVIIFGGINDFIQSIAWDTFTAAVDSTLEYIVNNYTQARIIVITPTRSYNTGMNAVQKYVVDYCNYIKQAAKNLSLPVIDATYESGFCPFNDAFKNRWSNIPSSGSGAGFPDGLHPNSEYMEKYLSWYLEKNLNLYN